MQDPGKAPSPERRRALEPALRRRCHTASKPSAQLEAHELFVEPAPRRGASPSARSRSACKPALRVERVAAGLAAMTVSSTCSRPAMRCARSSTPSSTVRPMPWRRCSLATCMPHSSARWLRLSRRSRRRPVMATRASPANAPSTKSSGERPSLRSSRRDVGERALRCFFVRRAERRGLVGEAAQAQLPERVGVAGVELAEGNRHPVTLTHSVALPDAGAFEVAQRLQPDPACPITPFAAERHLVALWEQCATRGTFFIEVGSTRTCATLGSRA